MKTNLSGFTLTELIAGLVIGAIILIIIGNISGIGQSSYENLRKEAEVYNDIFYGLNLIKHALRNELTFSLANNTLTAGNFTFRADNGNLTYTDISNGTNNTIMRNVNNLSFNVTSNNKLVTINLSGEKDKVSFNLSTEALRRN